MLAVADVLPQRSRALDETRERLRDARQEIERLHAELEAARAQALERGGGTPADLTGASHRQSRPSSVSPSTHPRADDQPHARSASHSPSRPSAPRSTSPPSGVACGRAARKPRAPLSSAQLPGVRVVERVTLILAPNPEPNRNPQPEPQNNPQPEPQPQSHPNPNPNPACAWSRSSSMARTRSQSQPFPHPHPNPYSLHPIPQPPTPTLTLTPGARRARLSLSMRIASQLRSQRSLKAELSRAAATPVRLRTQLPTAAMPSSHRHDRHAARVAVSATPRRGAARARARRCARSVARREHPSLARRARPQADYLDETTPSAADETPHGLAASHDGSPGSPAAPAASSSPALYLTLTDGVGLCRSRQHREGQTSASSRRRENWSRDDRFATEQLALRVVGATISVGRRAGGRRVEGGTVEGMRQGQVGRRVAACGGDVLMLD